MHGPPTKEGNSGPEQNRYPFGFFFPEQTL